MCGGIDDGLSDGVFHIGSESGAMEIAEKVAEKRQGVLIIGSGEAVARNEYLKLLSIAASLSMPFILHNSSCPTLKKLFKPKRGQNKCLLPSCEEYTSHNSGCCSKECKIENRQRINKKR